MASCQWSTATFLGFVIWTASSATPSPAHANCSSNNPTSGSTVTCSDADAIGITGAVGVNNVTVNVTSTGGITAAAPLTERGSGWVVNNNGSMSGTNFAIQTAGAAGAITIVNTNSITASSGSGQAISAVNGVSVTNSGTISGTVRGIVASGSFSTIVNAGTIRTTAARASNPYALLLNAGGSVTNQLGGTIFSEQFGVRIADGVATNEVINSGLISGTSADNGNAVGVFASPGASGAVTITNNATGTITGSRGGAAIDAGVATVTNSGVISGTVASRITGITNQYGLYLSSGSVTNTATGSIRGFDFGIQVPGTGGSATLGNAGTISASAATGIGVLFGAGGTITNEAGGTITGSRGGMAVDAGVATVTNGGVISGTAASRITGITNQYGLYLSSGSVTNTATGSIRGFDFGVQIPGTGGSGTLGNAGTISASAATGIGVLFGAGGTITNEAGGTITGGGGTAVSFAGANAASFLTNRGTLNGGIVMGNGNDTVVLAAGSSVAGTIDGGAGTNVLRLSAGSSATGTLSSAVTNMQTMVVDAAGTTWTMSGASTFTGGTSLLAGTLLVNGSMGGNVAVSGGATLGGSGTVNGVVTNQGAIAPGNSIGTLTVNGSYVQAAGGTYQVEVNAAGQSDLVNVTGSPGTALLQGGTVVVNAAPGTYARNTIYTIVSTTGGVSGTYAGATSNFAFLTPRLGYDANNVYLTLSLTQSAFADGGQTVNQKAVGGALDQGNAAATGDFDTVLDAMASLSSAQGPAALDQLSGEAYSGFAVTGLKTIQLFMNQVGREMATARGAAGGANRVVLAEACGTDCDGTGLSWSAWGNALGGIGSVSGDINTHTTSYTIGGFAAGVDVRFGPRFLAGVGLGYSSAVFSLGGLSGQGSSSGFQAALYGSFNDGGFYLDALAGYAYSGNQLRRNIYIPGLQPRTATGQTGANQSFARVEGGYRVGIYAPAEASFTPFARLENWNSRQNAFTEWGADSISLNVQGQSTTSVRSVIGGELAASLKVGSSSTANFVLNLGWAHEYADSSHPVTASFVGAPTAPFTVFGAIPARDSAIVGLGVNTAIGEATSVYVRYDGEIGSGDSSHALTAGFRMTW